MASNGGGNAWRDLRRDVGALAVSLPVLLAFEGFALCGCVELQPSISHYYGLRTRDLYVGVLSIIACFLFVYRDYGRKDDLASDLAGVFALATAFFPYNSRALLERVVHYSSALGLFLVLSYFSLCLFTKSDAYPIRGMKKTRNRVYKVCGVTMLVCVALIGFYLWRLQDTALAALKPVFWLETLALWAFGVAWFVKGKTLWKDAAT